MSERYSVLRPLSVGELYFFTVELWNFFSVSKNIEIRKFLSLEIPKGPLSPLSLGNFYTYLDKSGKKPNSTKFQSQVNCLAHKLSEAGVLIPAGFSAGSPGLNQCYYTMKELTTLQSHSNYWLSSILGENYLKTLAGNFIVRIEGSNSNGSGTGSGVLIAPDTILTCAHNILDMKVESCWVNDNQLDITNTATHKKFDVGIIKIKPIDADLPYPYLGSPYILDKTLTLGYPPIRGMREPALVAQSGEINAIGSETFTGCECIAISSITRPGNSGGPVFSMQGYIAGIVIEQGMAVASFSAKNNEHDGEPETSFSKIEIPNNKPESPFYLAISANALKTIIPEVDLTAPVHFEDYQ